jgi:CBS domain containing-hemolysin-like protein
VEKLEEHLGVDLDQGGDFETVGGLVFSALGHVPKPGETFVYKGLEITVQDADKRRVKEVRIRRPEFSEPHGEQGDDSVKP